MDRECRVENIEYRTKADELRALLASETTVAPGVFDGLSAAQARRAGARAVYVSGTAAAAVRGLPDMSVLALTELVETTEVVVRSSGLPTIVDVDTGYGGAVAIRRLVRTLASIGAAAVQIEDQRFPRRCGYLTADPPVATDEMLARLSAVAESGTGLVVVARTDALLTAGLDAAIERAIAYRDAGADLVMVNGVRTLTDLEDISTALQSAQLYNVSGSDRSPYLSIDRARDLNIAVVIYPIHAHRAAALAVERMVSQVIAGGAPDPDAMIQFDTYMDLAGWGEASRFEQGIGADSRGVLP